MKLTSKIILAMLLPAAWAGAQHAYSAKMQVPPSGNYVLNNVEDINTQYLDYCAVPYNNGIMFTSARGGKRVFVCDQDLVTGRYSDLYFAKEDAEGRFFSPDMVRGGINGKYHDGAPTFTPDGKTMIFSRNSGAGPNTLGVIDLKTYTSKWEDGKWEDVQALPFNNDNYSTCHPTLTADGKILFFSSNRPGGYGGMDIYAVTKDGDKWGVPVNLGPNVNSNGDEIFPFVTASNTLYFSSDGKQGMGGLDVFSVMMIGMEASQSLRLPAPINSAHDDFAFTSDKTEFKGYLTSDRPGGKGQDDIYHWDFNGVRPVLASVCVVDKVTGARIDDAELKIRPAEGSTWGYNDNQYSPEQEYVVLYTEGFSVKGPISKSCEVKVPVVPGENYYIEVSKDGYQPVRLLVTSTEMMATAEYLVPIEAPRAVTFTGVVRNRATDSPLEGSTVRILNKCTNKVEEYSTSSNGSFTFPLDCRCEYEVLAQKSGFAKHEKLWKTGEINCDDKGTTISMYLSPEAPAKVERAELEVGTVIELENVYYDYNKFFIRKDAAVDLDHVVELMKKYPTLEIELGSHTDARGSDQYNEWLSQQRAEAAVKYIVSKGIAKRRLTARGYGETQLTNHCANGVECDDATHEQNRRTEIKITRLEEKGVRY
ncbi:MAG: PD40 domain-containing protein [Saprospiraceae bacterium]|nr:PD40 domain-containing protein [Saprospiraceae bacterium]